MHRRSCTSPKSKRSLLYRGILFIVSLQLLQYSVQLYISLHWYTLYALYQVQKGKLCITNFKFRNKRLKWLVDRHDTLHRTKQRSLCHIVLHKYFDHVENDFLSKEIQISTKVHFIWTQSELHVKSNRHHTRDNTIPNLSDLLKTPST